MANKFLKSRTVFIGNFFNKLKASTDSRFEKIFSAILFIISLISIGVILRSLLAGSNEKIRNGYVNFYVIAKTIFAFASLRYGWYKDTNGNTNFVYILLILFTLETVSYTLVQIFCHDLFDGVNSFKRSILFAFLNYVEITFNFAAFYSVLGAVRDPNHLEIITSYKWYDYLYFSMGSGGIISYGNYAVFSPQGKLLVMLHCIIFLMFFSLFITYNVSLLISKKP